MKPLLICLLFFIAGIHLHAGAQQLSGIWSGKISRSAPGSRGVQDIELQLNQSGKNLSGCSISYKDTTQLVLYGLYGIRKKKTNEVEINETGTALYMLPAHFLPCEKFFTLKYYKIGKTQYLSGTWGGVGKDTSCFPGEELLVVLQKVKNSDERVMKFLRKKIFEYYNPQRFSADTTDQPEPENLVVGKPNSDSVPAERKLDIQEILKVKDTTVRVYIYDNAIVDGDTVSVFVDKVPVLVKKLISEKALFFELALHDVGKPVEIILQAENLGSIPPNTALMVVETAHKRYEVRLSSSFEKHAVVIVTYDPGE
jgi:hypothetical protein